MAEDTDMSSMWRMPGLGPWVCGAVFRRSTGAAVDEAISVCGLRGGAYGPSAESLERVSGSVVGDIGISFSQAQGRPMAYAHQPAETTVLVAWILFAGTSTVFRPGYGDRAAANDTASAHRGHTFSEIY